MAIKVAELPSPSYTVTVLPEGPTNSKVRFCIFPLQSQLSSGGGKGVEHNVFAPVVASATTSQTTATHDPSSTLAAAS